MGITQCFIMALKSLSSSKVRAFLTMLGIIIGVAAVIVIMSLGNGMQVYINDMFAELGTTTINVSVMGRGSTRTVDVDDMYAFYEEKSDAFAQMSPLVSVNASVRTTVDKETYTPTVTGVSEDYMDAKRQKLADGRNLTYIDIKENNKVCVVGAYYAYLYDDDIVGNYIKINGDKYTVVGVVEETDDRTDEDGGDNFVYVPYSTAAKFLARNANISSYIFLSASEDNVDACVNLIEDRLYDTFRSEDLYMVISNSAILDSMTDMINIVVNVLSAIAAISLVVGGIGIMNIMLVSVTERTLEIGIRKALGAKGRHIRLQFVIEAGTTSALGGVIGILLGVGGASVVSNFWEDFTAVPTVEAIALSFGISVAIGVLFGYLPANKAAKLNPIEALRHE